MREDVILSKKTAREILWEPKALPRRIISQGKMALIWGRTLAFHVPSTVALWGVPDEQWITNKNEIQPPG